MKCGMGSTGLTEGVTGMNNPKTKLQQLTREEKQIGLAGGIISQSGFTLIASLLMLLIMSGMAVGILLMVNTEQKAGLNDVQSTVAYRAAEGAIEKMTSDLSDTFSQIQAPVASDITTLSSLQPPPDATGVKYITYSLTPATNANGTLQST